MMDLQDSIGLTYMFITHDLSVVKHISDEIAVMYLGQCVGRYPVRNFCQSDASLYTGTAFCNSDSDLSMRGKPRQILKGGLEPR